MPKKNQRYVGDRERARREVEQPGSLYDLMKDGREYEGLLGSTGKIDMATELRRALADIEAIRNRPAVLYAGDLVKPPKGISVGIDVTDNLPFAEMIDSVPSDAEAIDILVETPGGLAQQVSHFVDRLRPRFRDVAFIIPHMAMSAGTIWALSGNEIWMDERAFIGPIDPQVQGKDGGLLPYQTIVTLLKRIQETGADAIAKGATPPWSDIQILRTIDPKEIGNAIAHTQYATGLAAKFLEQHKFRDWAFKETSGVAVTAAEKKQRALDVAGKLCSHEEWKVHGHGISRQVAEREVQLRINHPEDVPGLQRAIRRLAAMLRWGFEHATVGKILMSGNYALFRAQPPGGTP